MIGATSLIAITGVAAFPQTTPSADLTAGVPYVIWADVEWSATAPVPLVTASTGEHSGAGGSIELIDDGTRTADQVWGASDEKRLRGWVFTPATTGARAFTFSASGTVISYRIGVASLAGVNPSAPVRQVQVVEITASATATVTLPLTVLADSGSLYVGAHRQTGTPNLASPLVHLQQPTGPNGITKVGISGSEIQAPSCVFSASGRGAAFALELAAPSAGDVIVPVDLGYEVTDDDLPAPGPVEPELPAPIPAPIALAAARIPRRRTLRLEADGVRAVELSPENGYRVGVLELGAPEVRGVVNLNVAADGTDDRTAFVGAASVSMELVVAPSPSQSRRTLMDQLAPFLAPHRRPWLHFALDDGDIECRVRLRADQWSAPVTRPGSRALRLAWRAPDGVIEEAYERVDLVAPSGGLTAGREYPMEIPRTYPGAATTGSQTVDSPGTYRAQPLLRLYGPTLDPAIENRTAGWQFEFLGLTVPSGQYVEIDMSTFEVRMNGRTEVGDSRLDLVDWSVSDWGPLEPGENAMRYYPRTWGAGAVAEIRHRPARLLA